MDFYYTVEKPAQAEFKDRGSRFIAFVFFIGSVNQFKEKIAEVKKEHPKATHHCFAYRLGTDGNNFRVSDDGEPSGSAGRPILAQVDSKQLSNVLIVVVRYFGGTLLGVPGLTNAYRTAASMALQLTAVVKKMVQLTFGLQFDYTQLNEVMKIIKLYHCSILKQEIQLFCVMTITVDKDISAEVVYRLSESRTIEVLRLE